MEEIKNSTGFEVDVEIMNVETGETRSIKVQPAEEFTKEDGEYLDKRAIIVYNDGDCVPYITDGYKGNFGGKWFKDIKWSANRSGLN